ncbi:thioredoxin domain-containing protein [Patescibacteria group bacterium]|nr:thioredoxin domain-containing protein [Patescibacteria group bacterium]
MEVKKTRKIMIALMVIAVLIFAAVLFLNNHLDSKQDNRQTEQEINETNLNVGKQQSFLSSAAPVLNDDDFYSGDREAKLKIFVYEDYADIFSAELDSTLTQARTDFGDDLVFVYRPYNINHDNISSQTAIAISCAADQGRGEVWREKTLAATADNVLTIDDWQAWSDELDLNDKDFKDCLTNSSKKERIEELMKQASTYSVYGSPAIFVGDEMIVGARPYQTFIDSNGDEIEGLKQVIERQLK